MYKFQPVLELLRKKSVSDFQEAFGEYDETNKGVNLHHFDSLLKSKLRLDVKDEDVRRLFYQIDRYSKENITFQELRDYLDKYEKKRMLPSEGPFETTPTLYPGVRCQDSIIDWILFPEEKGIRNEIAGHYVYVSRSGLLSVWTKEMKKRFETTIETPHDAVVGKTTVWATSLTCFPKERLIAVATTAGDIRFFRSSIYKFEHRFSIVCLPYIVLRLNCYASQMLVCGDFSGNVYILNMNKELFVRIQNRAAHLSSEMMLFDAVKAGKIPGLSYQGTNKFHFSPVQKVEYIPYLNAIISCAVNTKRAMMIHFLENNESLSFRSTDGINCFAFCRRLNCVITGGVEHSIKIWNPIVSNSCNEVLTGHKSTLTHVLVVEDHLFLVSADQEKTIRIWDLQRPQCLQVIKFKESHFPGKQSFAALFRDPETESLILTTYRIGKLDKFRTQYRDKTHPCSEYIILAAYSSAYDCLVTVGNSPIIAVWDAVSGALIYEYKKSHFVLDSDGNPRNLDIMAASLDPSQRRLITADRTGTIKVWNFHLGLCLRIFNLNFIILSLSFVGFHIYAAGSSGEIVDIYDNGSDDVEPDVWEKHHKKTIISLANYRRNLVASATCDGEIIVWLRKSRDAKVQLKDLEEESENGEDTNPDPNYLAKTEVDKRRKCSISQLLFLQNREMDFFVGNLASCGMDGRIRFWNIVCTQKVNEGKLLTKFKAVSRDSDGILCMATDTENHYLINGDTMGYITVYEMDGYYDVYGSAVSDTHKATSQQSKMFPFLKFQENLQKRHPECSKIFNGSELGFAPFLLNRFRAHLVAVLKVNYVSEKDILITAGKDNSVRLWTISGIYVGRLGPIEEPWSYAVVKKERNNMPPDVKSVASSLTLFVLNNGTTPHWTRALKAVKRCRLGHQPEGYAEKMPFSWKNKKSISSEDLTTRGGTLEEEIARRLPYFRGTQASKQNFFDLNKSS